MSSHFCKCWSGDCVILQASDFIWATHGCGIWNFLYTSFYLNKAWPTPRKKSSLNVITSKGEMPWSVNFLRSFWINQLWYRINLTSLFFFLRETFPPPFPSQNCKYVIYNIYFSVWWKDTGKMITSGWSKELPAKEWFPLCGSNQPLMLCRCAARPDCKSYKHCHNIVRLL